MIKCSLDVTLVDKSKLFPGKKANKLGKCPQYLDLVLFENRNGEDQYGNHYVVVQSVSKEDREKGIKGAILGNAKNIGQRIAPEPQINQMRKHGDPIAPVEDDSVPF